MQHKKRGLCNVIQHIWYHVKDNEYLRDTAELAFQEAKDLNEAMIEQKIYKGFAKYFECDNMERTPKEMVKAGIYYVPRQFTWEMEDFIRHWTPILELTDAEPLRQLYLLYIENEDKEVEHYILEAIWMALRMLRKYYE